MCNRQGAINTFLATGLNGGERSLGIPTIRDRVIQTAAKIVIEPTFEADFEDNAYGGVLVLGDFIVRRGTSDG